MAVLYGYSFERQVAYQGLGADGKFERRIPESAIVYASTTLASLVKYTVQDEN